MHRYGMPRTRLGGTRAQGPANITVDCRGRAIRIRQIISIQCIMMPVSFGNGWNLPHSQWRQLYLLEVLYDRADRTPNSYVTIDHSDTELPFLGDVSPVEALADAVEGLRQQRLVNYLVHSGSMPNVPPRIELTRTGVEMVQEIRRMRVDPAVRRPAVRDALLRWLYESASIDDSSVIRDFWQSAYVRFWGVCEIFTAAEVNDASRWLLDHGYATSEVGLDGSIAWLTITPKGEELVEGDRSTRDDDRKSAGDTTITVTNSPGTNIANRSPGARQLNVAAMTEEGQRRIYVAADYLEQFAEQLALPERDAKRLPELVASLRAIAQEPAPDRGKLKRLLESARELAIAAGSIPLGAGLQALIHQAAHALGIG